jgi:hypothetical protein
MREVRRGRWEFDKPASSFRTARAKLEYRSPYRPQISHEHAEALEAIEDAFGGAR